MRHRAGWFVGLTLIATLGAAPAPVVWTPDGRWLAYTVAVRPDARLLPPGWLFNVKPGTETEALGWSEPESWPPASLYRIYTTRADTGASVLLEESSSPLTSPFWSPDGKALAFGRLASDAGGPPRFEVVIQDAPDRKRVVLTQPITEGTYRVAELPGVSLAWSPDGRYLAIPLFQQKLGLAIIRADNGRSIKEVPESFFPAWSPDGSKLAFVRGADSQSLYFLDTNFGPPRFLREIGRVNQAPVWSRDRRSVLVVAREKERGRPGIPAGSVASNLVRVPIESGEAEVTTLFPDPDPGDRGPLDLGTSFSFDAEGENLVFTIDSRPRNSIVTWFQPRTKVTSSKDNPIDFGIRVGTLALSSQAKTLAFRAGGPGYFASTGLHDVAARRFTPIVPDDWARVEWIAVLIAGARQILSVDLPAIMTEAGLSMDRASLLPIPGELPENGESMRRLRQLGKLGRALCDRPHDAPPASREVLEVIDEARLFFDYLRGDYLAALGSLETLEARTIDPDHRLRLLSVRAQIMLSRGLEDRAEGMIEFLQSLERGSSPRLRLEITPAGPSLTAEEPPSQGWPKYLAMKSDEWIKGKAERAADPRHGNPDAPDPPMLEALPFARGNFLELRQDDVPVVVRGGVAPPVVERMPPPFVPVAPRPVQPQPNLRRRQGFIRVPR